MSCPSNITTISRDQCIGNSLSIINGNFANLRLATCDNDARVTTLESERTLRLTQFQSLSSVAVPGAAKAWVKFDASNITQRFPTIYSSYNLQPTEGSIGPVEREFQGSSPIPGFYRISFIENLFPEDYTRYAVMGTSSQAIVGGKYTWLQPVEYSQAFVSVKIINSDGQTADAKHVSVIII